jgi:oxalate decarboxylase
VRPRLGVGNIDRALGRLVRVAERSRVRGRCVEVFRADRFEEVSLSDWLAHSPIDMVAETLNLDRSVIAQFPKNRPDIVPV